MNRHKDAPYLRTLPRPSPNPAALLLYSLRDALVKAPISGPLRSFHALPALLLGRINQRLDRSIASMSASESPK
jgi:hypothetical protein